MASALKRKRGDVDVIDTTKRAKPLNNSQDFLPTSKLTGKVGWDVAFNPPPKTKELVQTNGIDGHDAESQSDLDSSDAEDFEDFVEEGRKGLAEEERQKSQVRQEARIKRFPYTWKLSESIGGRMIDVGPVFTQDERYVASPLPEVHR
jgi:NET1-associated nuclear protein 1 (U3 small nucleolar RNA-associated protein 17)